MVENGCGTDNDGTDNDWNAIKGDITQCLKQEDPNTKQVDDSCHCVPAKHGARCVSGRKATVRVADGCKSMKRTILLLAAISAFAGCTSSPKSLSQSANRGVQPTVYLAITVDGLPVRDGGSVSVVPGQVLQLKATVTHLDGTTSDVTDDANTKWLSETPGVIAAGQHGKVVVVSEGGGLFGGAEIGAVGVSYGMPGDKEIGASSVAFSIASAKANKGDISAVADRTSLGLGESVRMKVLRRLPDGNREDISADSKTVYITTSESVLIPEGNGVVTHVGTRDNSTDSATITVFYGPSSTQVAFDLKSSGPGPTLEIEIPKTILEVGETQKFSVVRKKDAAVLTARGSGTQYVVFGGKGSPENELLAIDDAAGTITAEKSLGRYNRRSAILFVRNGNSVGWIELKLIHSPGNATRVVPQRFVSSRNSRESGY